MKFLNVVILFFLFSLSSQSQKIMGFSDANATKQLDWEKQFDAQLKASNQDEWMVEGITVVKSIEEALVSATETDAKEIMVTGGGEIYKSLFEKAKRIYLARVEAEPEADTFFPSLHPKEWEIKSQKNHEADKKNAYNYSFQVWERKD